MRRDMANKDLVLRFIRAWNERDIDAIADALAPEVVYHNMPMQPVTGREVVRAAVGPMVQACSEIDWRVLHIADSGEGSVLTERVDEFVRDGKRLSVRVMGVFEIQDGLITAWRDYFDLAEWQRQL
jgi:limonene-1,2-epoxide hydrolase